MKAKVIGMVAAGLLAASGTARGDFTQIDATFFQTTWTPSIVGQNPIVLGRPAVLGFDLFPDGCPVPTPHEVQLPLGGPVYLSDPLTTAFVDVGILLGADEIAISQPSNPAGIGARSLPNSLASTTYPFNGLTEITFVDPATGQVSPTQAAGAWFADGPQNDVMVGFYDAANQLITTLKPSSPDQLQWFAGIQADPGIAKMLCWVTNIDDYYMDDLYYIPTPEPATLSLLALGGLAVVRRRRRPQPLASTRAYPKSNYLSVTAHGGRGRNFIWEMSVHRKGERRMSRTTIICATLLGCAAIAHANLISNGGFEAPAIPPGTLIWASPSDWTGGAAVMHAQNGSVGDPTPGGVGPWPDAFEGHQYADIANDPAYAMSQSFVVEVSSTYDLSWADHTALTAGPSPYRVDVTDGPLNSLFTGEFEANHVSEGWIVRNAALQLPEGTYTLTFTSLNHTGMHDALIDAVAIVPEPATLSLLALGGLAVIRRRFRSCRTRRRVDKHLRSIGVYVLFLAPVTE